MKGIIKFKSKDMKFSYRISEHNAATILQYIANIEHEPANSRKRNNKGQFIPVNLNTLLTGKQRQKEGDVK